MSGLQKALLGELDKDGKVVAEVAVQFNPTNLKLTMTNSIDGAASRGRQVQQYNGSSSTTLNIDLEFDTADQGETDSPVDVRTLTQQVAKFVLPGGAESKQAPPRVRFRWGKFILSGVMSNLTETIDLFSADGVPLRASLAVTIKEQDPKWEALESGPGANPDTAAAPDRTAEAQDGESAADFLSRLGLPPAAWRAVAGGVENSLSLTAGASIDFNANLSVGIGLGADVALGGGGAAVSVDSALGLDEGLAAGVSAGLDLQAGLSLSAAGGVSVAAEAVAAARAGAAADSARAAFPAPGTQPGAGKAPSTPTSAGPSTSTGDPATIAPPPAGAGAHTASSVTGGLPPAPPRARLRDAPPASTASAPTPAAPRPLPQPADRRAISFGRGVPLRDQVLPDGAPTSGWVAISTRAPDAPVPVARHRGVAPWEALPDPQTLPGRSDGANAPRDAGCSCARCAGRRASTIDEGGMRARRQGDARRLGSRDDRNPTATVRGR